MACLETQAQCEAFVSDFISAIDVGTTKICALMARPDFDTLGNPILRVVGQGQAASRGIRRGMVVSVPEATEAVYEAIHQCEMDSSQPMVSAFVGIAGSHIATINSTGVSPVDRRNGVTDNDMQRALEGARAVALPTNQEVIHTIARHWTVDGQGDIHQPLGMNAYRLEVDAHVVTGSSTAIRNLVRCVTDRGVDIDGLVLEPLASDTAVLRSEERHMGVAVVDIGGGTTDIAVFREDSLCHTQVLDMGGNHLTNDIAIALHTPFDTAETLKRSYGNAIPERVAVDEAVWASVFGERSERSFSRRFICEVLEARASEIFDIIREKVDAAGFLENLPAGLVLTGGSSQLAGLPELGRRVLGMPVRVGAPLHALPITGLSSALQTPPYATTVGLLLWGMRGDAQGLRWRGQMDVTEGVPVVNGSPIWWNRTQGFLKKLLPG